MPRIVFTGDRQAAHLACQMLVWNGIPARVLGDDRVGLQGAVPIPALEVSVLVDDPADEERARALIAKVEAGGDDEGPAWICGRCTETNEPGFEICWNCRRPRDSSSLPVEGDSPYRGPRVPERGDDKAAAAQAGAAPGPPARWSDLVFTLLLAVAPVAMTRLGMSGEPGASHGWHSQASYAAIVDMLTAMECGMPLAILAFWRRGSLPIWGVTRPRWAVDAVAGLGLGLLLVLVDTVARHALGVEVRVADDVLVPVMRPGDWPLLITFTALASLTTQVVVCGVFFAGLERLLSRRAVAVVLAAAIGALMNAGRGTTWVGTMAGCLLLTLAFAQVRRIWPIAVASTLASLALWHFAG